MKTPETAQPYEWDWDGEWDPVNGVRHILTNETFSVGIFQWIPKASGNGLKRSKAIKRIKGRTDNPDAVYEQAHRECEERNKEQGIIVS